MGVVFRCLYLRFWYFFYEFKKNFFNLRARLRLGRCYSNCNCTPTWFIKFERKTTKNTIFHPRRKTLNSNEMT